MRSLESFNEAVGCLLDWNPGMSTEDLDGTDDLDARIVVSRTHYVFPCCKPGPESNVHVDYI